jgi:HEAT repeat protein
MRSRFLRGGPGLAGALVAGLGLLALAPTRVVAAAPLTLAEGADGAIELRQGVTVLARVPVATPTLRRGPARLREATIDGRRLAEVRVTARGTPREEVWIGELSAHGARVVYDGFVGPRDADAETSLQVELTPEAVLEYQTAAAVTRCDGAPARLFPRAFDFDAGRFRPVVSPLPPPARQTLIGRRGDPSMPKGRPVASFHFTAASTTAAAGSDARDLTSPHTAEDGDPATAWTEGLGGDGRGEFLTARAGARGALVRGLRIIPGDASSPERYRARNRVRKLQLALGPKEEQRFDVELPEDQGGDLRRYREPFWVPLPHPLAASCATVIITDVTPGTEAAPPKSFGATAISELAIITDLDGPDGAERLVQEVAHSAECASRVSDLVAVGAAAAAQPTAQAIIAASPGGLAASAGGLSASASGAHTPERECLVEALTRLEPEPKDAIVVEALVAALAGASEKEEHLVTAALARSAEPPVVAVAQVLESGKSPEDRARAARVLAALPDPRAAETLLAAAGRGPLPVREAIVRALATTPKLEPAALWAAIDATTGKALGAKEDLTNRASDLLRVVPAVAKRAPETAPKALTVLVDAAAPAQAFEVRGRAVMALGALGAVAVPALADVRAQADEPVLRHLAARELSGIGGADATGALRAALGDHDPRVRETAALGLGQVRDVPAAGALIASAKQEPWPFVRRAELEALGQLCGQGAADLLVRAIERDVIEVRRAALVGLARCKDPRAQPLLLRVLGRRNEASTVRELAAGLLGEMGDRRAAPAMAAALGRQVNESEEDMSVEGVAVMTLRSLARLGGPDATSAAVSLAKDKRHPFQTTAIDALGTLCDPGAGAVTLRELEASSSPSIAVAAQNAAKHCASR